MSRRCVDKRVRVCSGGRLTIADDWLEAGPNRAVGQRSPPMEGSDKGDPD